ncbi:MAG: exopolyphosphatase [Cohaesibacter sp.]|nr:exopolyphosphatase [Cohaesibacter sp.]
MAHDADDRPNGRRTAVEPAHSSASKSKAEEKRSESRSPVTQDERTSKRARNGKRRSSAKRQEPERLHGKSGSSNPETGQAEQPKSKARRRKGKRKSGAVSSANQHNMPRQSDRTGRDFGVGQPSKAKPESSDAQMQDQTRPQAQAQVKVHQGQAETHGQAQTEAQPQSEQRRRGRKGRKRQMGEGRQSNHPAQSRSNRPQQERPQQDRSQQEQGERPRPQSHRGSSYRGKKHASGGAHGPAQAKAHFHPDRTVYAALDLGTNNCRLLVAEPHGQSFRVVDSFSRIVRLGEGLSQTGRLSNEAQERAIAALKICKSKLAYRRVKRFRLIATEACRRALNGGTFLHRVYKETGLKLEIVNRETEARLAVAGCASLVHPEAEGVVLFDIGGGSSEIVWLDLDKIAEEEKQPLPGEKRNRQTRRAMRRLSERMRCWTSLQVGVVTLSEKHGGHIVTKEHFEAMVAEVREMLHEFDEREALAHAIQTKHIHMLGTSGTVTTLAGVHLGLERYDRKQVDGTWLSAQEVRSMIARVLEMDFEERIANPCIGQDRADLVLAGCAILEAFHREWPCPQLRVADRGLREGILMEMMLDDGVWTPQSGKKRNSKNRRPRRRGGRGHRGQTGQAGSGQTAGETTNQNAPHDNG